MPVIERLTPCAPISIGFYTLSTDIHSKHHAYELLHRRYCRVAKFQLLLTPDRETRNVKAKGCWFSRRRVWSHRFRSWVIFHYLDLSYAGQSGRWWFALRSVK